MDPTSNPIPALIILALYVLHVGINLAKHGDRQDRRYHVGWATLGSAAGVALLTWGGFFRVFGWHF